MSWSVNVSGRASTLAGVVKDRFENTRGCPAGSHEEAAKNALGGVAETLCHSFSPDAVVSIRASGSAWNEGPNARSQDCRFEFTTHGDFVG